MKDRIPESVVVGKNVVIGNNVTIGFNVHICNNVTIYDNVQIGDNVYIWDNVVIGKVPMSVSSNCRKINKTQTPVIIGESSVIACGAVIYCGAKIGSNCLISENVIMREDTILQSNVIIGGNSLIQYGVSIDERTRVLNNSCVSSHASIGKNNFISLGFTTVSDRKFGDNGNGIYTYDENEVIGPRIGDNNHIGPNVTILSNIVVGNNNTIGACALVSKDIGSNGVFYGVPAKYIKENK